jgi:hypothetical protein
MANLINTYLESWGEEDSWTSFSFRSDGGSATAIYELQDVQSIQDLQNAEIDIIGYTNPAVSSNQAINRVLPATHPAFAYMYAERISGMVGKGTGEAQLVDAVIPPITNSPEAIADQFALYDKYQIKVDFTTRNYVVAPDQAVPIKSGSWIKPGGSSESFSYAGEQCRYVDFDITPENNTVQSQQGSFNFNSDQTVPGTAQFTSAPWFRLPDFRLSVTWYQVPFRYITSPNSFINNLNWAGRVNQNPFMFWDAGQLLYLNYTYKKYNVPNLETTTTTDLQGVSWNSYSKLCDITLNFLGTNRQITVGGVSTSLADGNYIAQGFNLQPYLYKNRGFYYVSSPAMAPSTGLDSSGSACWQSAPFEAFFSDPDSSGGPSLS